ncbi:MAG: aminoacyl-tRNA deacylase [Rhodospirillales bacterium]|nr:aminoacyl-tRNA deacylase [Rhodospirillales bacterium]
MTVAPRVLRYLENKGILFDVVAHPRTVSSSRSAQAAHVPGDRLAKTVVVHHELGYLLAVVPSTHRIELGTLQAVVDRRLGLATEREIETLFDDCDLGAIPPIGAAYDLPVCLDTSLDGAPEVYFEGGDHTTLVRVKGNDFRTLMKDAQRASFSHRA